MKKKVLKATLFFAICSCFMLFNSCKSTPENQRIEVVGSTSYGEWEDWLDDVVVYEIGYGGCFDTHSGGHKVQRRIIDGNKEYRVYFYDKWFPVTETKTTAPSYYGSDRKITMNYRFVALGKARFFDM